MNGESGLKNKNSIPRNKNIILVQALISSLALWKHYGASPRDPFIVPLFFALFYIFAYCRERLEKKERTASVLTGAVLSALLTLGKLDIILADGNAVLWLPIRFIGFMILLSNTVLALFEKTRGACLTVSPDEYRDMSGKKRFLVFLYAFAAIYACFIVWLLCEYPGGVSPDSNNQLLQITNQLPYSNHHPIAHTLLIRLLFNLGMLLSAGDQNFSAALCNGVQAAFLASSFAFLTETLYEMRIKKRVLVCVTAVFIILPYHGSFSVTMWKDVWFGGIVLVWCLSVARLLMKNTDKKKAPVFEAALFCVFSLAMCLFRGNGLYAYVLCTVGILFVFRKKSLFIQLSSVAVLVLAFLITGPVYTYFGVLPTECVEPFSMPIQHISRAITEGAELTPEESELISKLIEPENIPQLYDPTLSDPVKEYIKLRGDTGYFSQHKSEYLKLWFSIGMREPGAYVRAQVDQTRGYWYPDVSYWVMGSGQVVSVGMELEKDSKLPALSKLLNALTEHIEALPFAGLIYSIGTGTWTLIILFAMCCVRCRKEYLILFVPVFAVLATILLASPVFAEFRYVYSMFTTLPLLGVLPFCGEK